MTATVGGIVAVTGGSLAGYLRYRWVKRHEQDASAVEVEPQLSVAETVWAAEHKYWREWLQDVAADRASGTAIIRLRKLLKFMYATKMPLLPDHRPQENVAGMHHAYVLVQNAGGFWQMDGTDTNDVAVRRLAGLLSSAETLPASAVGHHMRVAELVKKYASLLLLTFRETPRRLPQLSNDDWTVAEERQQVVNSDVNYLLGLFESWLAAEPGRERTRAFGDVDEESNRLIDAVKATRRQPDTGESTSVAIADRVRVSAAAFGLMTEAEVKTVLAFQEAHGRMSREGQRDGESLLRRLVEALEGSAQFQYLDAERRAVAESLLSENRVLLKDGLSDVVRRERDAHQDAVVRELRVEREYLTNTVTPTKVTTED